jgi:hypothetical protein
MWREYNSVVVLQHTPVAGRPARANHGAVTGGLRRTSPCPGASAKSSQPRSMDLRPVLRRDRQRHGPGTIRCTDATTAAQISASAIFD